MDEVVLTIGAAAIELGVPAILCVLFWRVPNLRPRMAVLLGTVTPALFLYAWVTYGFIVDPQGNRFAFFAGWVMTFVPYMAALLVGVALSSLPRPRSILARYLVGLAAPLAGFGLLIIGARLISAA